MPDEQNAMQISKNDFIVCPHCMRIDPHGWQVLDEFTKDGDKINEYTCGYGDCKKKFVVEVHLTATFTSCL